MCWQCYIPVGPSLGVVRRMTVSAFAAAAIATTATATVTAGAASTATNEFVREGRKSRFELALCSKQMLLVP